jgi:hypothetical protein
VQSVLDRVKLGDLNNRFNLCHRFFALIPSGIITVAGARLVRKSKEFMSWIGNAYADAASGQAIARICGSRAD